MHFFCYPEKDDEEERYFYVDELSDSELDEKEILSLDQFEELLQEINPEDIDVNDIIVRMKELVYSLNNK